MSRRAHRLYVATWILFGLATAVLGGCVGGLVFGDWIDTGEVHIGPPAFWCALVSLALAVAGFAAKRAWEIEMSAPEIPAAEPPEYIGRKGTTAPLDDMRSAVGESVPIVPIDATYPADWPTLGGGSAPVRRRTVPPVRYGGVDEEDPS